MKKIIIALIVFGAILLILLIYSVAVYSKGVVKKHIVEEEYSNISIAIENRWDAQETLLNAVKDLVEHSEYQLELITEARQKLLLNQDFSNLNEQIEFELSQTLLILEDNKTANVSQAYNAYMANSAALLNKVAFAKTEYNKVVTNYNTYINQPPRNIIFKIFKFEKYHLYTSN